MQNQLIKVVVAACLIGAATVMPSRAEQTKIGVAAEPYPPFASPDSSGRWVGWEIEIINALCAEAKLDCTIVPVAWDGIIPALTTGKIDAIAASMSITDERKKVIDFSNKYLELPAAILGPKDVAFEATPEALAGKIVGVQVSTTHAGYAKKHFTDSEVKEYQTMDEELQDVAAGRVDAVLAEESAFEGFLKTEQGASCCDIKGRVAPDVSIYGPGVGVGLRKGDDALREKINAAIKAIRANGTYQKISQGYFKSDVFGQ